MVCVTCHAVWLHDVLTRGMVVRLNAAQEEVLLLLSEIEESAREKAAARKGAPKGARSSGRVAGKSQQRPISDAEILQVMLQVRHSATIVPVRP